MQVKWPVPIFKYDDYIMDVDVQTKLGSNVFDQDDGKDFSVYTQGFLEPSSFLGRARLHIEDGLGFISVDEKLFEEYKHFLDLGYFTIASVDVEIENHIITRGRIFYIFWTNNTDNRPWVKDL